MGGVSASSDLQQVGSMTPSQRGLWAALKRNVLQHGALCPRQGCGDAYQLRQYAIVHPALQHGEESASYGHIALYSEQLRMGHTTATDHDVIVQTKNTTNVLICTTRPQYWRVRLKYAPGCP